MFADGLHQALLKANSPAEVMRQVEMQSFASTRILRETLSTYVASQQVMHPLVVRNRSRWKSAR